MAMYQSSSLVVEAATIMAIANYKHKRASMGLHCSNFPRWLLVVVGIHKEQSWRIRS